MKLSHIARNLSLLGAAALTLASVTIRPACAASPTGIPQFGSVDINKIQSQSTKKTKYDADLHALADKLDIQFKQQAASLMLTETEQRELGTLLGKNNRSDSETARVTALQTQATKAAQELTDLQQKKEPTPGDTARLAALSSQYEVGKEALQKIGDDYQAQLKALSDKDNADFTQSVREAIAAVAQQRGLAVVFTSDIAVYTANDISDEVVKRLNK